MSAEVSSATLKRRLGITDAVRRAGFIRTEALAEHFDVSSVTIRSDLAYLQNQNLVIRCNGGAQPCRDHVARQVQDETPTLREAHHLARAAARGLLPGQCVFLDNSQAASFVPLYATAENLRFLVNSFESFHLASRTSEASVALLGGEYDRQGSPLSNPAAIHALSFYDIDLAVISAKQISEGGFSFLDETGGCLETVVTRARHVFLLADRLDRVDEEVRLMSWHDTISLLHRPEASDHVVLFQDWSALHAACVLHA